MENTNNMDGDILIEEEIQEDEGTPATLNEVISAAAEPQQQKQISFPTIRSHSEDSRPNKRRALDAAVVEEANIIVSVAGDEESGDSSQENLELETSRKSEDVHGNSSQQKVEIKASSQCQSDAKTDNSSQDNGEVEQSTMSDEQSAGSSQDTPEIESSTQSEEEPAGSSHENEDMDPATQSEEEPAGSSQEVEEILPPTNGSDEASGSSSSQNDDQAKEEEAGKPITTFQRILMTLTTLTSLVMYRKKIP